MQPDSTICVPPRNRSTKWLRHVVVTPHLAVHQTLSKARNAPSSHSASGLAVLFTKCVGERRRFSSALRTLTLV